jgi:CBS domain-containing protein
VSDASRVARNTPVAACQGLLKIEPLIVHAGDDPLTVMRRAAQQPSTRLIGVVDDGDGKLIGVLPILRLAQAVVVRVAPEAVMSGLVNLDEIASFGHVVEARTIGDVMLEPSSVTPTSTIDEAFRKMHTRHQSGLYVVDDADRPTGYLDLLELVLVYVDTLEREALDPPRSAPDES